MVQAAGQTMMDPWGRCSWASRLFFSSPEDSAGTQRPCVDSNDLTFPIACWQNLQCAHQSWPEIDSIQRWFATSFFWVTLYKPSKLMSQQKSHSVPWWEEDGGVEGSFSVGHPFPQASLAQYPEGALQRGVPSEGKSSGIVTRFPRLLEHHTQVLLPFQPPRDRQKPRLVPGPSVFPSGEPGVSGEFWGSQEGCQGPSRSMGSGLPTFDILYPTACLGPLHRMLTPSHFHALESGAGTCGRGSLHPPPLALVPKIRK